MFKRRRLIVFNEKMRNPRQRDPPSVSRHNRPQQDPPAHERPHALHHPCRSVALRSHIYRPKFRKTRFASDRQPRLRRCTVAPFRARPQKNKRGACRQAYWKEFTSLSGLEDQPQSEPKNANPATVNFTANSAGGSKLAAMTSPTDPTSRLRQKTCSS
jgi:hypothetical protein